MGVIPVHLMAREQGKRDLTQLVITENMHERKKVMFMNSDAIVVLPGGAGSLDEFFEVLTWRQIGLHEKPIFLLNTDGYWQPLLQLLDHVIAEGFADATLRTYFKTVPDVATLGRRPARGSGLRGSGGSWGPSPARIRPYQSVTPLTSPGSTTRST